MSDHADSSARPAKRARLDDGTAPSLSAPTPQAPSLPAIDEDVEREVRAGITEYVCPDNLGFTGTLKQRYTDFLVNEIGLDGRVLHLKSTEVPRRKKGAQGSGAAVEKKSAEVVGVREGDGDGDVKMGDVRNGVDGEQKAPAEAGDVPAQDGTAEKQNGGETAEKKEDQPKPEAEEEVSLCYRIPSVAVLTTHSSPTKIARHCTRYSAKTSPSRSSNSSAKYARKSIERRKTSTPSSRRP